MKYKINDDIRIASFWGKKTPNEDVSDSENYWKLIGMKGKVIDTRPFHPAFPNKGCQVLVQLDNNINELGIELHNDKKNALWFFCDDIESIKI